MCVFVCLYVEPVSRSKDYIQSGIKIGSVSLVCCPRWWYSLLITHLHPCCWVCLKYRVYMSLGASSGGLWTLSSDFVPHNCETLKWLSLLPTKSFPWWQCSDRYIISLSPHLHTPFPPLSPSLISLVVSVDVKHHVYCLWWNLCTLYLHTCQVSYCRWLRSLLLYLCYVFWALINSLACWFCTSALSLILFQMPDKLACICCSLWSVLGTEQMNSTMW